MILTAVAAGVIQVFLRRQWLRYRRHQALSEVSDFVSHAQDFDSATAAAISLIQEVELVSRGYRLYVSLRRVVFPVRQLLTCCLGAHPCRLSAA